MKLAFLCRREFVIEKGFISVFQQRNWNHSLKSFNRLMVIKLKKFISVFDKKIVELQFVPCTHQNSWVLPKWSRTFVEFIEFSELRESEESLMHELGSI